MGAPPTPRYSAQEEPATVERPSPEERLRPWCKHSRAFAAGAQARLSPLTLHQLLPSHTVMLHMSAEAVTLLPAHGTTSPREHFILLNLNGKNQNGMPGATLRTRKTILPASPAANNNNSAAERDEALRSTTTRPAGRPSYGATTEEQQRSRGAPRSHNNKSIEAPESPGSDAPVTAANKNNGH